MSEDRPRLTRRGVLVGGAGLGVGLAAGAAGATLWGSTARPATGAHVTDTPVSPHGTHQAGIDRPNTPQRCALLVVLDLPSAVTRDDVRTALASLGDAVDACTTGGEDAADALPPDGPGDLTVTVGLGPRLVRLIDPALPGSTDLPDFVGDERIGIRARGGDLLLALYGSDATALPAAARWLRDAVPTATLRWQQAGTRGPGEGTVVRNPLGYHDGVMVPRGEELAEGVWIAAGPAAGGTIAVIRRLRIDLDAFHDLPVAERDRVIGRDRVTGAPLSGGTLHDPVDLTAKTPEGEYVVPAGAHVRAAHPTFTGSPLMLRRSYGYTNGVDAEGEPEEGLLFVSFQDDVEVFVRTQHRLDEVDDLMRFVRPTASATFLILPGRSPRTPLGAPLFSP